ncbi:methionine--tRNA ligase [Candidatus Gracilibacteria bacterium]|nr:methionine--tRNA ligase [Candidatus Gracilibacteria bacterium]NUJ99461.1 methionine--tRNA ligase [Candidatus Gracilibacteria bacterium]
MNEDKFFITTPIYYTNGIPHIGHSYSSIIADTIARYQKINGKKVKFSTGVDENSQKAIQKAEELGMEIMPYLDMMASKHKAVWDGLNIEYTDFIRTTEQRHRDLVQKVLKICRKRGDIYEGVYEGMYCIGCEAFKKDDDLIHIDKETGLKVERPVSGKTKAVCPDHLTEPQKIKEKNYFFRLSAYQDFLLDFYTKNPEFVVPQDRFNEVIAFVKRGLEDFSISRETNTFGIPLPHPPFDENQVAYVWFDALFNYVTVCKENQEGKDDSKFWPADLHIVGKDIIKFHAIYWPAMLKSAGYELPHQILTTGFFTVNGQKISKSLGNVIDPVEFSEKYSKDLLTLYLLSSFNIGQDGDFDEKQAIFTYNAKLANNLGNLVNRVVVLSLKLGGILKSSKDILNQVVNFPIGSEGSVTTNLKSVFINFYNNVKEGYENYNLKLILDESFSFLDKLNKFADEKQPWQMIKYESKQEETRDILFTIAEGLRQVGLALYPFFPEKIAEMFVKLGLEKYAERLEKGELEKLISEKPTFEIKEKGENLFNRIEIL